MPLEIIPIIIAYGVLLFATIFAVAKIRRRLRKQRPPLEFEYARLPGESLTARIEKANEKLDGILLLCFLAPPAAGIITLTGFYFLYPEAPKSLWISVSSITALGMLILSAWAFVNGVQKRAALELGLKGERIVADFLKPLEREGWHVFHDVPARQNGKDFNLDHVTIGPTGVALIETKTRSKGKAIEGREAHLVVFDGTKLEWPWGSSTTELEQLKRQREWLEAWIMERTGLSVPVRPVLTIPGWWTESSNPQARTRVANHKTLCATVKARGETNLDPKTIDLLARQLESICRIRN